VLGIDPGTVTTGWGVVEARGARLIRVAGGIARARGALAQRLASIAAEIDDVVLRWRPTALSIEKSFVAHNVQSAFRLGEARGAVMVAAVRRGLGIHEYSPAEIKLAVVGTGRATKPQVQAMVARLLGLENDVSADQADALAAAICHLHARRVSERVANVAIVDLLRARRRRSGRRWTHLVGVK
jgi:crossover junction endodeoxyribonuclease RuvC